MPQAPAFLHSFGPVKTYSRAALLSVPARDQLFLLAFSVSEKDEQIDGDHEHVDHVEDQNVPLLRKRRHVRSVGQFGNDARHIPGLGRQKG